jgi:hypothetical protein
MSLLVLLRKSLGVVLGFAVATDVSVATGVAVAISSESVAVTGR